MSLLSKTFPELSIAKKSAHFVGVGGIGMSALARWFLAAIKATIPKRSRANWLVSGSDLAKSSITQELAKGGLKVKIGHKKEHIANSVGLIVYSRAIELSNSELVEARRRKIPAILYSEAVGRLTRAYKTIAVAGAHGKSTTTALISLILIKAGFDPTVIIGTNLREFGNKNFRAGLSPFDKLRAKPYMVLEADEFGKSFLNYSPALSVVTNIDLEHLDTYKNLAGVKKAFLKFISQTEFGETVVLNKDSENLYFLKSKIAAIAKERELKVIWYSLKNPAARKIKKVMKIPGEHNLSNALAAYSIGIALKIPKKKILSAIGHYHGSWRRMEYKGKLQIANSKLYKNKSDVYHSPFALRHLLIYDDYAHHPTEIKATLKAFKEKYPNSPVVCVFQPHQAKRLQVLFKDFINAFGDADVLVLIPMYQVAGRDSDRRHGTRGKQSSKTIAEAIKKKYPAKQVFCLANPKKIKEFLSKILHSKSYILNSGVIVMMGAGDIVEYTPLLIKS